MHSMHTTSFSFERYASFVSTLISWTDYAKYGYLNSKRPLLCFGQRYNTVCVAEYLQKPEKTVTKQTR